MSDEGIIYVRSTIHGMRISGLWADYNFKSPIKNFFYKLYGHVIFTIFMLFNISQFIEVYFVMGDAVLLMQNFGVTLLYALVLLKAYTLHFRMKRIGSLLDKIRLAETRAFGRPPNEKRIYQEAMDWSWFITKWFWILCFITLAAFLIARPVEYWFLGPQQLHHYKIPFLFSSWFPFDKFSSNGYPIAYTFQILSGSIGSYYVGVVDTFIISFMTFGMYQFKMLRYAITHLHLGADETNEFHEGIDVYDEVVEIIQHHIRTIEYIEDLDDLINPIMFLNFLICSIMICAVGLEGIMSGLSVRLALNVEYLISLLIEVFNYYWHANEITVQCTKVGNAVSESQWYRFSPKVKKALIMIMLRSEKPSQLSVGGRYRTVYFMSLSTYLMILKATYSYLALFREIYSKE